METITNGEMINAIKNTPKHKIYNDLVQAEMNKIKNQVMDSIMARLPQCLPYRDKMAMDVPNLYYGFTKKVDGKDELLNRGTGASLLPNPTNGVMSNNTMIFSDTMNPTFNNYLSEEMVSRKGPATEFLDVWDYAHASMGNLHCASHAIPFCKPK